MDHKSAKYTVSTPKKINKYLKDSVGPLHDRILRSSNNDAIQKRALEREIITLKRTCDELKTTQQSLNIQNNALLIQRKSIESNIDILKQSKSFLDKKNASEMVIQRREVGKMKKEIDILKKNVESLEQMKDRLTYDITSLILQKEREFKRSQQSLRSLLHVPAKRRNTDGDVGLVPMQKKVAFRKEVVDKNSRSSTSTNSYPEFISLLDKALSCCICHHLYIDPVITNCSHVFCSYCLNGWRVKNNTCPICRAIINIDFKVKVVDEFISDCLKLFRDSQTREELAVRQKIIEERH